MQRFYDEESNAPVDTGKFDSLSGGINCHHPPTNLTGLAVVVVYKYRQILTTQIIVKHMTHIGKYDGHGKTKEILRNRVSV